MYCSLRTTAFLSKMENVKKKKCILKLTNFHFIVFLGKNMKIM